MPFASLLVSNALVMAAAVPAVAQAPHGGYGQSIRPVQYVEPGFAPAPVLEEFVDRDGNRVFVDAYGNVVSVVPPEEPRQPDWGQRGRADWGVRRSPAPSQDTYGAWPPPEPQYDPRGQQRGNDPYYGEPYPRADLQPDRAMPERDGPRPYTPPATEGGAFGQAADQPADPGPSASVAALQVLLDRAGISPGVIDGRMGSNVRKALAAYEVQTGSMLDPDDVDGIMAELSLGGGLAIERYTISEDDVAGPFIAAVPGDYAEKARLERLSYTSVVEKLAERFHMDDDYLRAINPNANFSVPGTVIKVAAVGADREGTVTRIVADKAKKQVFAYDGEGRLVAAYPATIGSRSTPSPTGSHTIERIALDPEYTYNPKINFQQGDNDQVLTIPPGPNGPVGSVWIALSKPTYGIHGTPDPEAIGKTESNGCIRLTNWDARELAGMVTKGVEVSFVEGDDLIAADQPFAQ